MLSGRISRIFIRLLFCVAVSIFSINDEISLLSNCFSSFDLSNKLGSILASHSDSSSSEKSFLNCPPFFRNFNPIRRLRVARNLSNQFSGVQISCDICTRFGRYLYSTKRCWIRITQNVITIAAKCNTDASCNKVFNAKCNNFPTQNVITFLTQNVRKM